jgi:hypothetical protein
VTTNSLAPVPAAWKVIVLCSPQANSEAPGGGKTDERELAASRAWQSLGRSMPVRVLSLASLSVYLEELAPTPH